MDDDEEEEDSFMVDTDGFTEASDFDVEVDDIDIRSYQDWREPSSDDMADASSDWLTDGDSFSTIEEVNSDSDGMQPQNGRCENSTPISLVLIYIYLQLRLSQSTKMSHRI